MVELLLLFFCVRQVGITLQSATPGAPTQPVLILNKESPEEGTGFVWTSYDTGLVECPLRPDFVPRLARTHTLAITGKILSAVLEEFPTMSKHLQHIKVQWSMTCWLIWRSPSHSAALCWIFSCRMFGWVNSCHE